MQEELTYEQTIELEKNVRFKNEAEGIYRDFLEHVTFPVKDFVNGKFKWWNDSHNETYFTVKDKGFTFVCNFLHENEEKNK